MKYMSFFNIMKKIVTVKGESSALSVFYNVPLFVLSCSTSKPSQSVNVLRK